MHINEISSYSFSLGRVLKIIHKVLSDYPKLQLEFSYNFPEVFYFTGCHLTLNESKWQISVQTHPVIAGYAFCETAVINPNGKLIHLTEFHDPAYLSKVIRSDDEASFEKHLRKFLNILTTGREDSKPTLTPLKEFIHGKIGVPLGSLTKGGMLQPEIAIAGTIKRRPNCTDELIGLRKPEDIYPEANPNIYQESADNLRSLVEGLQIPETSVNPISYEDNLKTEDLANLVDLLGIKQDTSRGFEERNTQNISSFFLPDEIKKLAKEGKLIIETRLPPVTNWSPKEELGNEGRLNVEIGSSSQHTHPHQTENPSQFEAKRHSRDKSWFSEDLPPKYKEKWPQAAETEPTEKTFPSASNSEKKKRKRKNKRTRKKIQQQQQKIKSDDNRITSNEQAFWPNWANPELNVPQKSQQGLKEESTNVKETAEHPLPLSEEFCRSENEIAAERPSSQP